MLLLLYMGAIPKIIKPGPCLRPARTTCAGWSTTESHRGSSANCLLLLEKRIWCWRHLAQIESSFNAARGLRRVRVGGCHAVMAVLLRTEKIDRMSIESVVAKCCLLEEGGGLLPFLPVMLRTAVVEARDRNPQRLPPTTCPTTTTTLIADSLFFSSYTVCDGGNVLPRKPSGGHCPRREPVQSCYLFRSRCVLSPQLLSATGYREIAVWKCKSC